MLPNSVESNLLENISADDAQIEIPLEAQPVKRRVRRVIHFWNDDEVKRMLNSCRGNDYMAIGLGYFLALRVTELRLLRVSDIDFKGMKVWVIGKGDKKNFVPMLRDANRFWAELKEWVSGQPLESYIIHGRSEDGSMSKMQFNRIVKKVARRAGFTVDEKNRAYFHMLRHSRASNLYSKTSNLSVVQEFLRHSRISTTEVYRHTTSENLKKAIDRFLR